MVMAGATNPWFLGRQEGMDASPLAVSQLTLRQSQDDRGCCGCGLLPGMTREMATLGPRLVCPPPMGPAQ